MLPAAYPLIATSPALAADLPHHKLGLWEIKTPGGQGSGIHFCIDAATDEMTFIFLPMVPRNQCPKIDMQRSGNSVMIDVTCMTPDKRPFSVHTVTAGSFDSAYTTTMTLPRMPPLDRSSECCGVDLRSGT